MRPQRMVFVDDAQAEKFEKRLQALLLFVKGKGKLYEATLKTLINDNINMFNRIKELENERRDEGTGEEAE